LEIIESIFSANLLDIIVRPIISEAAISLSEYSFTSFRSFSVDHYIMCGHQPTYQYRLKPRNDGISKSTYSSTPPPPTPPLHGDIHDLSLSTRLKQIPIKDLADYKNYSIYLLNPR
jgi:hypothetical protein